MSPKKKNQFEKDLAERMELIEELFKKNKIEHKKQISKIEEDCNAKINKIEEDCKAKISKIEEDCNTKINKYEELIEKIKEDYLSRIEDVELKYINNTKKTEIQASMRTGRDEEQYRNSNVEISKPTFYGSTRDQHPRDFLNRMDEYFKIKQTNFDEKLIVIGDCLKSTAYQWFATIRFKIQSYEQFKNIFMEEFWSREIQIQTWSQCLNTTQITSNITYREHFSNWANKLRHLEIPMLSESEIVRNIANHYPGHVRAILISLPERSILNAMKILGEEEIRRSQLENNSHNNNQQEVNRNHNNHHQNTNNRYNNNNQSNQQSARENNNNWRNNRGNPLPREDRHNTEGNRQQINQVNVEVVEEKRETNGEDSSDQVTHAVNSMPTNHRTISPYIQCEMEGVSAQLLIDTGATISVLTKEIVDKIIQNNSKVPVIPINGVQISNAVGKKICKISKQIFCECKIGSAVIFANFVQVENLNEKGIIGADILQQYNARINFKDQTVIWDFDKKTHTTSFANIEPKIITEDQHLHKIQMIDSNETYDHHADKQQNEEILQLLDQYQNIFSNNPGKISKYQCQIKIKEGEPIYQKPYPIPMVKMAKMNMEIQRMLDLGIIEKSTSPWSSPVVGIEKKNGDIRICIDARKINQRIIPDRECPMNIEEILMKFEGAKFLSSIDLTAGYWQCPLKPECREITAFLYQGRNYQYKVLPFGLINSVAEFQKILDKVLGPEILNFVAVYVDDIHIMSKSFSEHINHLEQIFRKFSEHNVKINIKKSQFLQSQILFLGHVISKDGIQMDPDKIKAIQNFQPPKTRKQIQSFLGFINFYRKYIRDLSEQTSKLSDLLKKGTPWNWTDQHQTTFMEIKELFLKDIIIQYPNFNEDFYISTDASRTAIGAELFQFDNKGNHKTLGFISRTLQGAEKNYHTTELELLAIIYACKKFRNYILGYPTKIMTDHKALIFLKQCKLLNARLTRWAITIQEYNLEVIHIPGKENIGADTLTRYPQSEEDDDQNYKTQITINKLMLHEYSKELQQQLTHLDQLQRKDPRLSKIINRIYSKTEKHFTMHNNLLYSVRKNELRVMIPDAVKHQLTTETHIYFGHVGAYKVYHALKHKYQFKDMYNTIKRITRSCDLCQKSKINTQNTRGPTISLIPSEPRELISLDLMGPLPRGQLNMKHILALLDTFSKHVKLYALRRATTNIILKKLLNDYVPKFGPIKKVLTDNGTQFTSRNWKAQLEQNGIRTAFTTTYHPESNPVERTNREIGRLIRSYCHHQHSSWVKWLETIEYWLNNTTHHSTGLTPHQILTGKNQQLSLDKLIGMPGREEYTDKTVMIQLAGKRLRQNAEKRNHVQDRGKKFPTYSINQQILVKEHKLSSATDSEIHKFFLLYHGPYIIKEVHPNNTVVVENDKKKKITYNFKNIKLYIPPDPGESGELESITN